MAQTVVGLFDSASDAQQAVSQLISNGFSRDNIDVSSPNAGTNANTSTDIDSTTSGNTFSGSSTAYTGSSSNDYSGSSSTGSSSGSSSFDSSSREGSGSGIGNFFRSLFGNDDEADRYSNVAQRSGSVVTVHVQSSSEAQRAADILDDNGAIDVNEKASQYGYSSTGSTGSTDSSVTADTTQGTTSIPIIEEELQVGKRTVQTGGARLRSRIIERPVEENLRLREERVTVERTPVDRVATDADFATFKEGTIELTEHAEVPVVTKEARVVEEISLGKEVEEREHTVSETVRKTEVDIENLGQENQRNTSAGTSGLTGTGSSSSDLTDLDDKYKTGSNSGNL